MTQLQITKTLTDLVRFRDEFITDNDETRTVSDILECEYSCADNPVIMSNIGILRQLVSILDNQ